MIKKIKRSFFAALSTLLLLPMMASAIEVTQPSGVSGKTDLNEIILDIVNWFLTFLGGLSILMIVVAGIMYITSGGDEGRVETAKKWLTFAIVGLVVALLSYVIVSAVNNALTGA